MNWQIEPVQDSDFEWIKPLFKLNEGILGSADMTLWRYQNGQKKDQFVVIRPHAFAHFNRKKNGEVMLYEIAVDPKMKRQGLGKALLDYMGTPMLLKTDADNIESNAFYKKWGFVLLGSKFTKSGKKVNVWKLF